MGQSLPWRWEGFPGKTWRKKKTLITDFVVILKLYDRGFPGGTVVEGLPANAGDTGSSPGLGGSHMPRSN